MSAYKVTITVEARVTGSANGVDAIKALADIVREATAQRPSRIASALITDIHAQMIEGHPQGRAVEVLPATDIHPAQVAWREEE